MSWGEAKWIKDGVEGKLGEVAEKLEDMERRYLVGDQRDVRFPRDVRIDPDKVYGLVKEGMYCLGFLDEAKPTQDSNANNGVCKIYKKSAIKEELNESGVFIISIASTNKNTMTTLSNGVKSRVGQAVFEEFEDISEGVANGESLKYMVYAKGTYSYKYVGLNSIIETTYSISMPPVSVGQGIAMSTYNNTGTSGTVSIKGEISEELETQPATVEIYVKAERSGSVNVQISSVNVQCILVGYREGVDMDTLVKNKVFLYLDNMEKEQITLSLNKNLYGIPGNQKFHNIFDGENYWLCDTADIKTRKVVRRVSVKKKYFGMVGAAMPNPSMSVDKTAITGDGKELIKAYLYGYSLRTKKWAEVETKIIEGNTSISVYPKPGYELEDDYIAFYMCVFFPGIAAIEETCTVTKSGNLDDTFVQSDGYYTQSNLIVPYMQPLTDKGDFEIQSFYCASENIDTLRRNLTGKVPISEGTKFSEMVNCAEMRNLESKYVTFLNQTDEFGISPEGNTGIGFVQGTVWVQTDYDYSTKKNNVISLLGAFEEEPTIVSTLTVGTSTDTIWFRISICKVTDSSGYIKYHSHNSATDFDLERYIRPFKVDAAGKMTWGTAMKILPADSATVTYMVDEIPSLYDPYGVCFLIRRQNYTKYTYEGETYYAQASETVTMRTVYFRPNDVTYTNINSSADTTLGTSYEGYLVNGAYQSPGKTSVLIRWCTPIRYCVKGLKDGKIELREDRTMKTPFFERFDRVRNSADELTKAASYLYAHLGAWREAPTSYNYNAETYNVSTGECTLTVDKPFSVPWKEIWGGKLLRVIRNGEGIFFVTWKTRDGNVYTKDWYDRYTEIWEYCPATYIFHKTTKQVSDFV